MRIDGNKHKHRSNRGNGNQKAMERHFGSPGKLAPKG
jgi:hypothetical protein